MDDVYGLGVYVIEYVDQFVVFVGCYLFFLFQIGEVSCNGVLVM